MDSVLPASAAIRRGCRSVPAFTLLSGLALGLASAGALAQPPADDGAYRLTLEEVLVTAQKREESRMTVPIAVNTFSEADILTTSALDIADIDDFMPGVRFGSVTSNQSTQLGVEIRGVSSPNISSGQDPSVATFYDNAYLPRAVTSIPFVDIERIEVLKGPQGTLYGRNATAGVVNMIPYAPAMDEFDAFARARVGNYGLLNVEGMVNIPVGDRVAIRANVLDHAQDAIFDNRGIGDDLRERNYSFGRLAIAVDLSEQTHLKLAGDIEKREENTSYSIGVSKYALNTDPFASDVENDVPDRDEDRDGNDQFRRATTSRRRTRLRSDSRNRSRNRSTPRIGRPCYEENKSPWPSRSRAFLSETNRPCGPRRTSSTRLSVGKKPTPKRPKLEELMTPSTRTSATWN